MVVNRETDKWSWYWNVEIVGYCRVFWLKVWGFEKKLKNVRRENRVTFYQSLTFFPNLWSNNWWSTLTSFSKRGNQRLWQSFTFSADSTHNICDGASDRGLWHKCIIQYVITSNVCHHTKLENQNKNWATLLSTNRFCTWVFLLRNILNF